jgi:hypothetical protein
MLHMEHVWRVMCRQLNLDVTQQSLAFITGRLDDLDPQTGCCFRHCPCPTLSLSVFSVLLQHNEIGDRLNGHQTYLWMKCFILANGDLLNWHILGQTGFLLLAKLHHNFLHRHRHFLLDPIRSGHQLGQTR